jgi:hypothetical protein
MKRHVARPHELIAAHEIACFAYCPEQWRLQHGLGKPAGNQAALDAGTRHHAGKAMAERIAGWSLAAGRLLLVAALALLLLWVLQR